MLQNGQKSAVYWQEQQTNWVWFSRRLNWFNDELFAGCVEYVIRVRRPSDGVDWWAALTQRRPQHSTARPHLYNPIFTSCDKVITSVAPASGKDSAEMCINTLLNTTGTSYQQQLTYMHSGQLQLTVNISTININHHHRLLRQNGSRYKYVHKIRTKIQR